MKNKRLAISVLSVVLTFMFVGQALALNLSSPHKNVVSNDKQEQLTTLAAQESKTIATTTKALKPAQKEKFSFDHNKTGFPLSRSHQAVQCESCHANGVFRGTPKVCLSCHVSGGAVAASVKSSSHI
jgi:hypothetical protein